MLAGFQHHFGAAQHSLCRKGIGLIPGHSLGDGGVGHGFNQYENIGGRAAADRHHGIHQPLGDDLRFTKAAQHFQHGAEHVRRHLLIGADSGDAFAHHGGGIGHGADDGQGLAEGFRQPGKGFARSDGHDDLAFLHSRSDFLNHFLIELGLYGQHNQIGFLHDFLIALRRHYAASGFGPLHSGSGQVMDGDFFGRTDLIFNNAADHGAGHVAAADKSEFHTKTSFLKMVEVFPPRKKRFRRGLPQHAGGTVSF